MACFVLAAYNQPVPILATLAGCNGRKNTRLDIRPGLCLL
jgi:hypothetical protein